MLISFLFLDENICRGYSLEAPHRGASNEYPQHMFSSRNTEALLMSTHNICFRREIRKILCGYPLLSVAMCLSYRAMFQETYLGILFISDYFNEMTKAVFRGKYLLIL